MSDNFEKILCMASKRVEDIFDDDYFNNYNNGFCELYPFTTENIDGYISSFDLKDKSLLTVGSSGDQVLNAILNGCKDITVLDVNPYVKFYYYLKVAVIINLDYDKFMFFFRYKNYPKVFKDNRFVFSKNIYNSIKDTLRLLDYESYLFWDELFQNYKSEDIRRQIFSSDEGQNKEIITTNTYLKDKDNYFELKSKVGQVGPRFINDDIFKSSLSKDYFGRGFDNIWLSNISSYYTTKELVTLVNKLDEVLNENGSLLISYMYDTQLCDDFNEEWPIIYDLDRTLKYFEKYNPLFINFLGIEGIKFQNYNYQDAALVYKKNR